MMMLSSMVQPSPAHAARANPHQSPSLNPQRTRGAHASPTNRACSDPQRRRGAHTRTAGAGRRQRCQGSGTLEAGEGRARRGAPMMERVPMTELVMEVLVMRQPVLMSTFLSRQRSRRLGGRWPRAL